VSPKRHGSPRLLLRALACGEVWRRAAPIGLTVGLFQAVLNQGDHWLHHQVTTGVVIKTILSPLITLSVALLSAAATHIRIQKLHADHS
jgi:type III secretory pathway component EscS